MRPLLLTVLAMLAFAANSILCRMALGGQFIDAASFTSIRLISGALLLAVILALRNPSLKYHTIDIKASVALFLYAISFSFAYVDLSTGTGALILFGTVQLTIIVWGVLQGDRPKIPAWAGILLACSGLVYLVLPGVSAPSAEGTILMVTAGLAWGVYTFRGKGVASPIAATTWNFIGAVPLTLAASLIFISSIELQIQGILLAILSGALASAAGYVIWYAALPYLQPTSAAAVQLSVPMIAAFGGVLFLGEPISLRLVLSSMAILGGLALVIQTNRNR
ncbi:MAG: DMT family transporter [Gammaproteobacteria bacterium]|nr:DMT family transporter [Gammaproteobacteria bacterium]